MRESYDELYNKLNNDSEIQRAWEETYGEIKKNTRRSDKIAMVILLAINIPFFIYLFNKITIMNTVMTEMDDASKQMMKSSGAGGAFIAALFVGFIFYIVVNFFLYVIVHLFTSVFKNEEIRGEYKNVYKEKVVGKLLYNFYKDIYYAPYKAMPSEEYREGKYESYDNYSSDDYMEINLDGKYKMKMAEVKTTEEETHTVRDDDGNTHTETRTVTLFCGLYAKIKLSKSINDKLYISRDGKIKTKEKIKMDSKEFESYFDVKCEDKVLAMQILTHDVMEKLVNYMETYGESFDIRIFNSTIYIRVRSGGMFEPGNALKAPVLEKYFRKYYETLEFIDDLSHELIKVIEEL